MTVLGYFVVAVWLLNLSHHQWCVFNLWSFLHTQQYGMTSFPKRTLQHPYPCGVCQRSTVLLSSLCDSLPLIHYAQICVCVWRLHEQIFPLFSFPSHFLCLSTPFWLDRVSTVMLLSFCLDNIVRPHDYESVYCIGMMHRTIKIHMWKNAGLFSIVEPGSAGHIATHSWSINQTPAREACRKSKQTGSDLVSCYRITWCSQNVINTAVNNQCPRFFYLQSGVNHYQQTWE